MDTDFAEDDGKQWVDAVRQLFVARLPSLEEVNIAAWLSDDLVLLKKIRSLCHAQPGSSVG